MRNECNIVRDILPLCVEQLASPDTAAYVQEHLSGCAACREEYAQLQKSEAAPAGLDIVPLTTLRRKLRARNAQTIACTAALVLALLVSAFTFLSAPQYAPYSETLMSVTENADNSVTITFEPTVTDCSFQFFWDLETEQYCYNVEAWFSLWDRWFSAPGTRSLTIRPERDLPFTVYYLSNDGGEDVCIYGRPLLGDGRITLPRLTLGYYQLLALFCFAALLVLYFIFRHRERIRIWLGRALLFPVSYLFGHAVVLGFGRTSYAIQRDFSLILLLSVLIYFGLLLAQRAFRIHRECRALQAGGFGGAAQSPR